MRYDLSSPFEAELARTRLASLIRRGTTVEVTEKRQRSLSQNAYLHVCLAWFGLQVGESMEYVKQYYYKQHCNADLFVREKYDPFLGRTVKYLCSSRDLDKEDMHVSIERFRDFASQEAGVYIPSPEEHAWVMQMENEVEKAKRYLY